MAKAQHKSAAIPVTLRPTQTVDINPTTTNATPRGSTENHVVSNKHGQMQVGKPPRDLQKVREWVLALDGPETSGRQARIAEGARQIAALTRTRDNLRNNGSGDGQDGGAHCPATDGHCQEQGYGPYGIHIACVSLDFSTYCE